MTTVDNRLKQVTHNAVGLVIQAQYTPRRNQRGLSQSTENAVLLTGAVALAIVVLGIVGRFVRNKLGELG